MVFISLNLIIMWAKSQSRGNRELKYKQGWKMRNENGKKDKEKQEKRKKYQIR